MKREYIVCDCCGSEVDQSENQRWEHRPGVFSLKFPRDGINGGEWNMDVCCDCRNILHDTIRDTIRTLRDGAGVTLPERLVDDEPICPHCKKTYAAPSKGTSQLINCTCGFRFTADVVRLWECKPMEIRK